MTQARRPTEPSATKTRRVASPGKKPTTIDEYLAAVPPETRALLEDLRKAILRLVPGAEECISYSMPAFRIDDCVVGGFAATKNGGSFYPFSGNVLDSLADLLTEHSRTKSALHFSADKPLPKKLVAKLLAARRAEIERTGH